MARGGILKSEVKKARDALIAQDRHPSVDAVRIELGNTGSKTTIIKYLNELEEEEGNADRRKASISEALQDLVERLAAQMQQEADAKIDLMRAQYSEEARVLQEQASAAERSLEKEQRINRQLDADLQEAHQAKVALRTSLQQETVLRHTAEQQVADFKDRLAELDAHRRSLEEKHQHAWEALEHYRESVKLQRSQDETRHAEQVRQLQTELRTAQETIMTKQADITQLHKDGATMHSDLSHARQDLAKSEEHGRKLAQRLEELQAAEQRNAALATQLASKETHILALVEEVKTAINRAEQESKEKRLIELVLAGLQAKQAAQQELVEKLRSDLKRGPLEG
jgi:DNA repair exonuclease SbcCD ATPase subunit